MKDARPVGGAVRPVPLKSVYTGSDLAGIAHLGSMPGEWPYVRGPHASMYTGRPWTIRQYTGYADAADTNLAFRTALAHGAQGVSVAFDLPTQRGYDSDSPTAWADVGLAGVAIDTADDMAQLFDGIPLGMTSVSMTMNGAVLPVMAAFVVAAEEQGVPAAELRGTIQNDILKEYVVRNTWIHAPEPSLRIVADVALWLAQHAPHFNALSVSGYHFQEAGAGAVLELALTLANARAYVDVLKSRGMSSDDACSRMSFFRRRQRFLHGDREAASGTTIVGGDRVGMRRGIGEGARAAYALPDVGLVAGRAGTRKQYRARDRTGDGSGVRRYSVFTYERLRRGTCVAVNRRRAARAQYAVDSAA